MWDGETSWDFLSGITDLHNLQEQHLQGDHQLEVSAANNVTNLAEY